MDEEARARTEYENSPSDPLHRKIRALRLPDYPDVRIGTDILTEYCDKARIVVFDGRQPLYEVIAKSDDLEDMDLTRFFTERVRHYKAAKGVQN
jgi:hypothetical protein